MFSGETRVKGRGGDREAPRTQSVRKKAQGSLPLLGPPPELPPTVCHLPLLAAEAVGCPRASLADAAHRPL